MKKHFFWLFLFTASFYTHDLLAQKLAVKIDSGRIDGADYEILFPANWKGKLVMYAHGYEVKGIVQEFSKGPFFLGSVNPFLEKGFAVAASDYSSQCFAYEQGVNETEALRKYVVKKYGKMDSTFIAGGSMGGAVALATLENFGKNYNGGLPLCPLAGKIFPTMNRFFDLLVTFNALFPGIEPSLSDILLSNQRDTLVKPMTTGQLFSRLEQIKKAVLAKDSIVALAYGDRFEIKLNDLSYVVFLLSQ